MGMKEFLPLSKSCLTRFHRSTGFDSPSSPLSFLMLRLMVTQICSILNFLPVSIILFPCSGSRQIFRRWQSEQEVK